MITKFYEVSRDIGRVITFRVDFEGGTMVVSNTRLDEILQEELYIAVEADGLVGTHYNDCMHIASVKETTTPKIYDILTTIHNDGTFS